MNAPRVGRPTSPTPSAPLPAWQAEGRSRASRRGWPGVSGGLDLGGPPAARRAAGTDSDVGSAQATPILLTRLLTTNLDERGRGWNCPVATGRASGRYGQRRPDLDEPDLATDQKVGGSSPSERAPGHRQNCRCHTDRTASVIVSEYGRGPDIRCDRRWPVSWGSGGAVVNAAGLLGRGCPAGVSLIGGGAGSCAGVSRREGSRAGWSGAAVPGG